MNKNLAFKKWFRRSLASLAGLLAILLIIALISLYLLPAIAVYAGNRWYQQQGENYQLAVDSWEFSPFKTQLEIKGLQLNHPGTDGDSTEIKRLYLSFDPWALSDHRVVVRSVEIEGLGIHSRVQLKAAESGQVNIAGIKIPLATEGEPKQQNNEAADHENKGKDEDQQSQSWQVSVQELLLKNETLNWNVKLPESGSLKTTVGQLNVEQIRVRNFDSVKNQPLDLDIRLNMLASADLNDDQIRLKKPLSLKISGKLGHPLTDPQWQGDVQVNGVEFRSENISLNQPLALQASGQLNHILTDPQWQGNISIDGVDVSSEDFNIGFSHLSLEDINADKKQQSLASLELKGLMLRGRKHNSVATDKADFQPLIKLDHYQLNDFTFSGDSVTAGEQTYYGLAITMHKLANGQLEGLPATYEADKTAESEIPADSNTADQAEGQLHEQVDEQSKEKNENSLLSFSIAGLKQLLQDSTDSAESSGHSVTDNTLESKIAIRDYSVNPPLKTDLTVYELETSALEGKLVSGKAELKQPVKIHLVLGMDKYNRIKADTDLTLFERHGQQYPQGNIKVKITQLDLTAFNGYLAQAMGYNLQRGMLEADINLNINKARLNGEIRILLRNSKFVPVDEAAIARVSKQISMPVDTALDLLRDDNGNVRVTIPVDGDLTDPDFGLGDLTEQLSVLALKTGAMYYLKQALQPYTTFINLASFAGDYLMKIRLDPLKYENSESDLTEEHQKNLKKVAGIMQDKKSLELQVCPFVSNEEAQEEGDGWPQLARQRGAQVKGWLAAQDESLAPRITLCKAQKGDSAEVVIGFN